MGAKSWERAVLCWIMRNISNFCTVRAGLRSSRTTARTGQLYYNKQVEQFLAPRDRRGPPEVYYQPVYSLHQQRFVTLCMEALSRLRIQRSAGFHRIFLSVLQRKKSAFISRDHRASCCGASFAAFCAENLALRASIANVKINPAARSYSAAMGVHPIRIPDEYGLPYSCFQFDHRDGCDRVFHEPDPWRRSQAAGIECARMISPGLTPNLNTVSAAAAPRSMLPTVRRCSTSAWRQNAALFYQSIVSASLLPGYRRTGWQGGCGRRRRRWS